MMTRMTSFTLATAALALSTSAAIALDAQRTLPPESAQPGIEGSTSLDAATATRVTPEADAGASAEVQTDPAEDAADASRLTPEADVGASAAVSVSPADDATRITPEAELGGEAGMQADAAVEAANAALANGGPARALSIDGEVLGHIRNASIDDRGMPVFSLLLDPSLGLEVETVTYGGEAMVVGEEEIALQLSRAQLVGAVEDWIQTRN